MRLPSVLARCSPKLCIVRCRFYCGLLCRLPRMPLSYACRRVTLELCFDLKRCILLCTAVSPHAGRQAFATSCFASYNTVLHLAGVPTNLGAHHHCCRAERRWTGDNSPLPCSDHSVHARDMPCAQFVKTRQPSSSRPALAHFARRLEAIVARHARGWMPFKKVEASFIGTGFAGASCWVVVTPTVVSLFVR
ncbi:unnamed protein product [Chondrus crispus]|uniref:Uncharacterized protein n=1 Tax=Chondrus crispus TaxID=2769 RepID=R7Q8I8_CHOCR|nr:unnamed protein product [Chondrus crispus]CDF33701.1 unnamed protein product [Chondrus crispus]|eukprot:XP_005713520.1 unnamed protein product [Chondrus crispus]